MGAVKVFLSLSAVPPMVHRRAPLQQDWPHRSSVDHVSPPSSIQKRIYVLVAALLSIGRLQSQFRFNYQQKLDWMLSFSEVTTWRFTLMFAPSVWMLMTHICSSDVGHQGAFHEWMRVKTPPPLLCLLGGTRLDPRLCWDSITSLYECL